LPTRVDVAALLDNPFNRYSVEQIGDTTLARFVRRCQPCWSLVYMVTDWDGW